MSDKDGKSKEFLRVNERFADAFNYYMYDGNQVIKPENLEEKDVTELLTVYGIDQKGKTNSKTQQKWRDLLKHAIIKEADGCYYVLLGIENHSDIHYAVVVKNMIYDALNYGSQVTETARKHRNNKDAENASEFLSGFTIEDKLIPVITLTIYWGAEKWNAPRSLFDMFSEPDIKKFSKFMSDYKLNLIVPSEIDDFNLFSTELGNVLVVIKVSNDEKEMDKVIKGNPKFNSVGNDVISVLNTFTGLKLKVNGKGDRTDMCKAWEEHGKNGEIKGRTEERELLNKLNSILIELNRLDDLKRSTEDIKFQTELINELVLKCTE